MDDVDPRPCSIASSLTFLGEKWSFLVVRELALGVHRFDAIRRNTGAPRDVLTEAGRELRPILLSLAQWGDRWAPSPRVTVWEHECGAELELEHTCAACGGVVTGGNVRPKRYVSVEPVTAAAR
jgi:DNA-binding HxlR family transcriptional regulator